MKTNVLTLIITLVVGVILTGALLGPVISDVSKTSNDFDNSSYAIYNMKELETGDNWTYADSTWSLNGDALTTSGSGSISVIVTDNAVIRQNSQARGTTVNMNGVSDVEIIEVTDSNALSINDSTEVAYTAGYGATGEGQYIMKTYSDKAYVTGDTPIWATGITSLVDGKSKSNMVCHIEGTINDGLTVTVSNVSAGTVSDIVVGEYTLNATKVDGYKDLYLLDNVVFGITANYTDVDTPVEYSINASYSTFILPKTITAELSDHLTPGQISLMGAIPIMVIVALLMTAVGAIALRRND